MQTQENLAFFCMCLAAPATVGSMDSEIAEFKW